ncbi:DUF4258 domain-containing protein [Methylobacterium brachythecii]|uniref:DUF4258 domain-containing protein n=1 Tax=Methylobacterium brachythecii TaxID=1176177 RepID=A0A7W6AS94_9HYPH|nr:DUF4258 domain-containing protein [Methylobacterium brachythecii]MBB3905671.1 hypothetical protein [Methylobacterium brachythecii]GLS46929.1 hypothetical protein GCM10007884_49290 [Methylobacterium brachythecii]
MLFTYGPHAVDNLDDRQIQREWVERTVTEPEILEPDKTYPDRLRAFRALPERDGRVLRVVYLPTDDGAHIITMFLDRGRRRRT